MKAAFLFGLVVLAVVGKAQAQGAKLSRAEVVLLVDQSDRISPRRHPGQIARDTAIVRIVASEFRDIVSRNRYLFSRDRLRAVYIGEQTAPTEPRVDVAQMNAHHVHVVDSIDATLGQFVTEAQRPYFTPKTYRGADIWGWFKNTAPMVLNVEDPNRITQTRLIILTDGYLEFVSGIARQPGTAMRMDKLRGRTNWQSLYPSYRLNSVGHKFANTKALILEIAPVDAERNTTEQEIIERYWTDWFRDMGVETQVVANTVGLPTVQDIVHQFLAK